MSAKCSAGIVVIALSLAGFVSAMAAEGGDKEKVAEGRYEAVIQDEGEKGEYAEDWVLYRIPTGFLVEAQVHVSEPKKSFSISNLYWLDSKMTLSRWEMQFRDPTPQFGCELAPEELRCWTFPETGRLPISEPYGLVPIFFHSGWFVVSWVRAARIESGMEKGRLKVVVWDLGDGPDDLVLEELKVVELGREKFSAAGAEFDAEKVRIVGLSEQGEISPGLVAWLTPEGVPLGFQWEIEGGQPQVTRLVQYKKYAEFGAGK